jgi:Undecaprenyl-phosphate glucose phosphotransferase
MDDETANRGDYRPVAERIARGLQRPAVPAGVFACLAAGMGGITITLALWFAGFLTAGPGLRGAPVMMLSLACAAMTCLTLWAMGAYRLPLLRHTLRSAALACGGSLGWAFLAAPLGIWPQQFGAFYLTAALLLAVTLLLGYGVIGLITRWAREFGLTDRTTILVGGGKEAASVLETMTAHNVRDLHVVGLFDDRVGARSPDVVMGVPKLGPVADLIPFARQAQIDAVIIAFPLTAKKRIREISELLRVLPVDVQLSGLANSVSNKGELITLSHRPLNGSTAMIKRGFDMIVALIALLLLAPVLIAVALAVKMTSRGPVFFHQQRHGYNNTVIEILKFRSMYVDQSDRTARKVVGKGDPRVTPVGRFIRRWSLDELPQLINVLRGDLSLVGPRPHVVDAVYSETTPFEELVDGYAARHRVPPGITGWAQINGWRGEIDDPERLLRRVEHDLYYIENSTLWFDLWILLRTIPSLFNTKYAY